MGKKTTGGCFGPVKIPSQFDVTYRPLPVNFKDCDRRLIGTGIRDKGEIVDCIPGHERRFGKPGIGVKVGPCGPDPEPGIDLRHLIFHQILNGFEYPDEPLVSGN